MKKSFSFLLLLLLSTGLYAQKKHFLLLKKMLQHLNQPQIQT
mgnify:CR=1 FL=1